MWLNKIDDSVFENLKRSQVPITASGFDLQIFGMQRSYLICNPSKLPKTTSSAYRISSKLKHLDIIKPIVGHFDYSRCFNTFRTPNLYFQSK